MLASETKAAMIAYFERSAADWRHRFGGLPRMPRPDTWDHPWFAELEGVLPGSEPFGLHDQVLGYRRAHGGKLDKIPIGLESTRDLLLVVDNATGAVEVEDYEVQRFEPLAGSIADLINGLRLTESMPA